ncbi:hypothetical protein COT86_03625 [Candidatus Collierbacteria bacterium CG10_big_fil_rev_8_21_14_0_10_43_36]|uniref:Glycosyltransferase 2-like domain-containing protein n=3 Tax=Candidatus Collieribacteriota TaxID=1752725 RepID=A0A2H0DTT6_9BACT|nr:MAG: hypothetical protein COW83_03765 [Candidatus Collierbacteria bacterium CG22_combo_CG10-13_8_21_14_all_43_12]PIR99521.1 MAG: hypothetical protein COT86_03625 [Candidatus Collierbacteria bacterium CG10_big_fil_rev_8_21_14_0_10_43_36]PJB48122.1 MAG: hypothetical protein CO104_01885 [Candidatus Collierbacteria bacterium CG_4_9_14_3_um_filter_43_16]
MKPTIDIVIPSYNAEWLLEKNLPVVLKTSPEVDRIIVVDDGGTDNALEYLKKWASKVICVRHERNIGFSKSVNEGVSHSKADFLVFINNDVYPKPGYIRSALKYFQDPKVFAVNFNEENSSWPQVSWHSGKFQFVRGEDKKHPHFSAWPSGGSCILRRSIWDKLGGFNEIYSPAYWEDIDIGWRAWRSGYKIVWAPEPKVVHHHESTFGLKNKQYMDLVKQKNELLFTWQNISDSKMLISHFGFLVINSLRHLGYLKVIFTALKDYLSQGEKYNLSISDTEVFHLVNTPYED